MTLIVNTMTLKTTTIIIIFMYRIVTIRQRIRRAMTIILSGSKSNDYSSNYRDSNMVLIVLLIVMTKIMKVI